MQNQTPAIDVLIGKSFDSLGQSIDLAYRTGSADIIACTLLTDPIVKQYVPALSRVLAVNLRANDREELGAEVPRTVESSFVFACITHAMLTGQETYRLSSRVLGASPGRSGDARDVLHRAVDEYIHERPNLDRFIMEQDHRVFSNHKLGLTAMVATGLTFMMLEEENNQAYKSALALY